MLPYTNRLTRASALALAIAAAAAPAAVARPVDGPADWKLPQNFQTADTRDAVTPPQQDLRNADTRDYAEGRGTYNAPEVVVVDAPKPVAQPTADGIDWAAIGLGAGGVTALSLIALGGGVLIVRRRGAGQLAS
jgi:hypothetical protein